MARSDIFAQLAALDVPNRDVQLPEVDLNRIGLVYLLKSAEARGLPISQVQRFGLATVTQVAAQTGGLQMSAGATRCLRVMMFTNSVGAMFGHVVSETDLIPFTTVTEPDGDFGRSEPDGLVASSVITAGRTTADASPVNTRLLEIPTTGFWPNVPVFDVPPGHVAAFWAQASNVTLTFRFWAIEIGP